MVIGEERLKPSRMLGHQPEKDCSSHLAEVITHNSKMVLSVIKGEALLHSG